MLQNKKILVVSQNYYPEQFRINDICKTLVEKGCDVTVLTGLPNYPQGKIYDGYDSKDKRQEIIDGVKVIRVYERPRGNGGAINLFLNYYSFVFSSLKYVKKLDKDFDYIFVNQLSPVMQAKAALKYKKKYGAKVILYCLDLWPASLAAGGVKKGSVIYNIYKKVSKKIYSGVDKILVSSKCFKKYFKDEFGFNQDDIEYLPQYAEDMFSKELKSEKSSGAINLVFAGNVGNMQSVETIVESARQLADKEMMFHIVGGGSCLEKCKELAQGLQNIKFYGQLPLDDMPKFYQMADAMIVSLKKDDLISYTLPGKVQTYMAAGKPIIASGDNEMYDIITEAECGYVSKAEDVEGLKQNILAFAELKNKEKLGKNARKYYEENFSKDNFFKKLEETF